MRITSFAIFVAAGTLAASACLDNSITGTRPVTISLDVSPETVMVGEEVTAFYQVTGTGILGVIVNWGDGLFDSVSYSGAAVEAAEPVIHTYADTGSFDIVGTIEAQNGVLSATAGVVVN